jgi:hypothetical protein
MSPTFSSITKLTLTALSAATLVACGGGNDDKPPPVPLSSECAPPASQATATSNYRVNYANGASAVRNEVLVINEPVEFDGRHVVRTAATGRSTFNAPVNWLGHILYDTLETYYVWNTGGSRNFYGDASTEKWDHSVEEGPHWRVAQHYTPAIVNSDFTALEPGQRYDTPINGKRLETEEGETTSFVLNSSTRHTYIGQETITVPAGNLLTCRFAREPGDGTVQHEWYQHGTGVLVRRTDVAANGVVQKDEQLINTTGFR